MFYHTAFMNFLIHAALTGVKMKSWHWHSVIILKKNKQSVINRIGKTYLPGQQLSCLLHHCQKLKYIFHLSKSPLLLLEIYEYNPIKKSILYMLYVHLCRQRPSDYINCITDTFYSIFWEIDAQDFTFKWEECPCLSPINDIIHNKFPRLNCSDV